MMWMSFHSFMQVIDIVSLFISSYHESCPILIICWWYFPLPSRIMHPSSYPKHVTFRLRGGSGLSSSSVNYMVSRTRSYVCGMSRRWRDWMINHWRTFTIAWGYRSVGNDKLQLLWLMRLSRGSTWRKRLGACHRLIRPKHAHLYLCLNRIFVMKMVRYYSAHATNHQCTNYSTV